MWLEKLKQFKKESGLTTSEIAAATGIPEPTLVKMFAGIIKDPKVGVLTKVAHALGRTLDDFDDLRTDENYAEARLLQNFRRLNGEGRAAVLDYADTMVASGKYKP